MALDILGPPPEPRNWRFRTLELTTTVAYDAVALRQAMTERASVHQAEAGPDSVRVYEASRRVATRSGDWERHGWRVWWTPPSFWREELTWPNGETVVIIVRPDVASYYVSMQGTLYTSQRTATATEHPEPNEPTRLPTIADRLAEFPLTGFRLPAADWETSTLGREPRLGRALRGVRATRRVDGILARRSEGPSYWPWLDHFECLVDDDLGILLELAGMAGGGPVARATADELRIDAEIPEDIFSFAPPPRTRIVHLTRQLDA